MDYEIGIVVPEGEHRSGQSDPVSHCRPFSGVRTRPGDERRKNGTERYVYELRLRVGSNAIHPRLSLTRT